MWTDHETHLIKQIFKSVLQLSQFKKVRMKNLVKLFVLRTFIRMKITVYPFEANVLYLHQNACAISTSKRLCSLQKRAAKFILHQKIKHTRNSFDDLQTMPFHVRVNFKTHLLMHKVFNDLAPPDLKFLFTGQCLCGSTRAIVPPAK